MPMKEIVIRSGFHPETPRVYHGEHIYKIGRASCRERVYSGV